MGGMEGRGRGILRTLGKPELLQARKSRTSHKESVSSQEQFHLWRCLAPWWLINWTSQQTVSSGRPLGLTLGPYTVAGLFRYFSLEVQLLVVSW